MTLVIKSECIDIKDGACADVCPVDCIYEGGRMFYIHPTECIECGICESICPVDAIRYDDEVTPEEEIFVAINRDYFSLSGLGDPGGWNAKVNSTNFDHPHVANFVANITANISISDEEDEASVKKEQS